MGRVFNGRDVYTWKVVAPGGAVLLYPEGHPEGRKVGRPMNDLDGFRSANELALKYGGFAVRA